MAYEVKKDEQLEMVDVRYSDRVPVAERVLALDETLEILRATEIRRILIDYDRARLPDDPIPTQSGFATLIATNAELKRCRIAFVGRAGHTFNIAVENMSSARGYSFERFFDRDSALAWLLA
ncbi:hypothetical protein ACFQZQ_11130 [Lysobacter koreensis]|uniref:STAS/SEC14 domain-containing protein n=1 Tax=Lysobacter koreensis TaxID=266122 RepID=A0ABW2YNP9_9GAMM